MSNAFLNIPGVGKLEAPVKVVTIEVTARTLLGSYPGFLEVYGAVFETTESNVPDKVLQDVLQLGVWLRDDRTTRIVPPARFESIWMGVDAAGRSSSEVITLKWIRPWGPIGKREGT